jgi:hypothetical protein
MQININCEVTEYYCLPDKKNQFVSFSINEKAVVISFLDGEDEVIVQSEISLEDFTKISKIITK